MGDVTFTRPLLMVIVLSSIHWDLIQPVYKIQNLITLASSISEIWLVPTKI